MSKHTGWSHESTEVTPNGLDELICDEHGRAIAWAYKKGHARLIAQAPRLLEALERVTEQYSALMKDCGLSSTDTINEARAAIEATKGNDNG